MGTMVKFSFVVLVLAQDYKSFCKFRDRCGLPRNAVRYIVEETDLSGFVKGEEFKVVKYGDWHKNPRYYEGGLKSQIDRVCGIAQGVREVAQ